jgi:hypothetical protein
MFCKVEIPFSQKRKSPFDIMVVLAEEANMTKVSQRKTKLRFETDAVVQRRNIIVEVNNGYYGGVRLKGMRQSFAFSWQGLYEMAAEQHARRVRAEKKGARR